MSIILFMAAVAANAPDQAAQAQPASVSSVPEEKRICRRMPQTGSLVQAKKECRTRAEWDLLAGAARQNGQDMMERNAGGVITN